MPTAVLLAAMLAGIAGLVSSIALRRGLAVVGSVLVLVVANAVVVAAQEISIEVGNERVAVLLGVFSPWTLSNGLGDVLDAGITTSAAPHGAAVLLYVCVGLLVVIGCVTGLVARFTKAGRR